MVSQSVAWLRLGLSFLVAMVPAGLLSGADVTSGNDMSVTGDVSVEARFAAAVAEQDAGLLESLLEAGADPDCLIPGALADGLDTTPLLLACRSGWQSGAEILVVHGADPSLPGESGEKPFAAALEKGYVRMALFLLHHGADTEGYFQPWYAWRERYGNALYKVALLGKDGFDGDLRELADALMEQGMTAGPMETLGIREYSALYVAWHYREHFPVEFVARLRGTLPPVEADSLCAMADEARARDFQSDLGEGLGVVLPLAAGAALIGTSVACREWTYAGNPDANWMTGVNASLAGAAGGLLAGGFVGFQLDTAYYKSVGGSGAMVIAVPVGTILLGSAGVLAGLFLPAIPGVADAFRDNPALYYLPSALAGGGMVLFVWNICTE